MSDLAETLAIIGLVAFLVGCWVAGSKVPRLALLLCPVVVVLELLLVFAGDSGVLSVAVVLTILAVLLGASMSRAQPGGSNWARSFARYFFLLLGALGFIVGLSFLAGPFGILGAVIVFSIGSYLITSRLRITVEVFSTIGSVVRQNLPLAPSLAIAARGRTDRTGRTLRAVSELLSEGNTLADSLRWGYPQCPGGLIAQVAAGEASGQLPAAVAAAEADLDRKNTERRRFQPVNPAYPLVIVLFVMTLAYGIRVVVVPSYQEIFADMGSNLPSLTRFIFDSLFAEEGVMILLPLALIIIVPLAVYVTFRPRRPDRPHLMSRVGDFVKWHLPPFRGLEWHQSAGKAATTMAMCLRSGGTIDSAIDAAAGLDVNGRYRRALRRWHSLVVEGMNPSEAARASRVGSPMVWAFNDKVNAGNALAALEAVGQSCSSKYSYARDLARLIFWPCVVIAMAALVAVVVLSLFLPMVSMLKLVMVQGPY